MLTWLVSLALAVEPETPSLEVASPMEFVRVEDPDAPGALARSATGALLAAPPTDGSPWRWETLAVPDGQPGDVNTAALGAEAWHDAGFRGQGVRVAIFDLQWEGALDDPATLGAVATADCWSHPTCEVSMDLSAPRYGFDLGSHGVACAQVVRSIAPDAEVFLVRVNGYTTFESAADWAIRNGIDVISMSLSFFNESFYDGSGPFADVVARLGAAGVLTVVSSGNYAGQHWSGPWVDGDLDGEADLDGDGALSLELGSAGRRSIYVNWDEHFACGRSDLDVVVEAEDGTIVGRGEGRQVADGKSCTPVERVSVEAAVAGTYRLRVIGRRVAASFLSLDVITLGGHFLDGTAADSLTDPGSIPGTFTVGAVRAVDYATNDVEGFSSQGPGRGGAAKPDVAGPDGLTTDVYGARGFYGTSAATPAVAGAAALVLSRWPDLAPREAGRQLQAWALRDDARVDDPRWGAGKVRLPPPAPERTGCLGRGAHAALLPLLALPLRRRRAKGPAGEAGCRDRVP